MVISGIKDNDPLLEKLQANILKGHGRNFARHLFFAMDASKQSDVKNWIGNFAKQNITSAQDQLKGTKNLKMGATNDAGTIFTLSMSSSGYAKLGLSAIEHDSMAFKNGIEGSLELLGDDKKDWEEPFKSKIDLLIIIADESDVIADKEAATLLSQTSHFFSLIKNQPGNVLKMESGIGIEHFGYADGISQPLFLESDISRQKAPSEWNDASDSQLILVKDPGTQDPDAFGSFLVFRKLEQNVFEFNKEEDKLPVISDADDKENNELAGAMVVGRFENGIPTTMSSTDKAANPPVPTNDFSYENDKQALKCPFHSHIRLMNPRKGDDIAGDVSEHRITRRGIPYDEAGRIPIEKITCITDEMLKKNPPTKNVGLLFMCYQKSIENQFEILQAFWANKGTIGNHEIEMNDSIIGQGPSPRKTLPKKWGAVGDSDSFAFSGFVTMKGGEYFFSPSLPFLRSLGDNISFTS